MAEVLFYLLAAGAVVFGIGVIAARMPIYSVLSLLGTFFCVAGVYLLMGFQFLAATQLLVYAGAIMVLFLFVIMLLNLHDAQLADELHLVAKLGARTVAVAAASAGGLVLALIYAAQPGPTPDPSARVEAGIDQLQPLAEVLFSRYALPFEVASLLLLATMVAVIVLAKRQRHGDAVGATPSTWPWTDKGAADAQPGSLNE